MLKVDFSDLKRLSKRIGELDQVTDGAIAWAMKRSSTSSRKIARDEIRKRVNLQASYINQYLKVSVARDHFIIRGNYRGTLLTRFAPSPKPDAAKPKRRRLSGISVQVKSKAGGGVRKRLPGAFYLTLKNSKATGIAIKKDGKIDVLHGPSTHQVLGQIKDDIAPKMAQILDDNLERELPRRLKRWTQKR